MNHPAIRAEGVAKSFGSVRALAGIDLAVPPDTVLGLLGPNGAGKTVAVRILTTILRPDAGIAEVMDIDVSRDPQAVRERIGLAGQFAAVDENLTGAENLELVRHLAHLPRRQVAPGAASCSTASASATPPIAPPAPTPAAGGAGSTWRRRWSTGRRCCSSTSPPPGSTRPAAATCGRSSTSSSAAAPPSCSPRSTWKRPTAWPTTSR